MNYKHGITQLSIALILVFLSLSSAHARKRFVMINAWAHPTYTESRKTDDGGLRPETYIIMQGNHFSGAIRDTALAEADIQDIGKALERELKVQNYLPSAKMSETDIIIKLSYGSTEVFESLKELGESLQEDSDNDAIDFGGDESGNEEESSSDSEAGSDYTPSALREWMETSAGDSTDAVNAHLLGYDKIITDKFMPETMKRDYLKQLRDERYFIILEAFDLKHYTQYKEIVMLWTMRFSLQSAGVSFEEAYHTLAKAASPYFGTNQVEMKSKSTVVIDGSVTLGDLEVLEVGEDVAD